MPVNNVSLLANVAYNKVMNSEASPIKEASPINDAVKFHTMVDQSFNQLSKLSPAEILARVNDVRASSSSSVMNHSSVVQSTLSSLNEDLKKHDKLMKKAALGDVSLVEMLKSISELKNNIQILVVVRDKLSEALEKLMNMQV